MSEKEADPGALDLPEHEDTLIATEAGLETSPASRQEFLLSPTPFPLPPHFLFP